MDSTSLLTCSSNNFLLHALTFAATRLLGKRMHEVGLKEQRKWKIDLGAAIYTHGFRLTIAIVVLFTVLIPRMLGVNIFS